MTNSERRKKYYITEQVRGNRHAYIIRENGTGIELAWATSIEDAEWAIRTKFKGINITEMLP